MKNGRKLLRVLRVEQEPKVSQARIATDARLSQARYWQIENGVGRPPTPDERAAIAKALGIPTSQIDWPEMPKQSKAS